MFVGFVAVIMLSAANTWGAGFLDDFDRPDGEVGNGWSTWTDGTIETKIVNSEVLIAGQQGGNWYRSGISRPIEGETRFSFDFKADNQFNVHIELSDADWNLIDVWAWPGGYFSYGFRVLGVWSGWTQIPGSEMIAGQYNTLMVEQEDAKFILTLNGKVIGTVTNNNFFRIGEVFIGSDAAAGTIGSLHIDNVQIGIVMAEKARDPRPKDGAFHDDTWVTLSWKPGQFTVSHDVYLGEDFDVVNDAMHDSDVYRGNQEGTFYVAGFPGFAYPEGLVPGTTYYWRIDEVNNADPNSPWKGPVWRFSITPRKAYNPSPADGAKYVDADVTLKWTGGFGVKLHHLYLGANLADVEAGTGGTYKGPVDLASYKPAALVLGTTYYWRVDEFDGAKTHKGDVWSFTTIPDLPITDPDLMGWWKLDEGYGTKAVDSSGHANHGTISGKTVWVDGYNGGALQFDGTSTYIEVATGLAGSDAGSVAAWIKTTQSTLGMIFYGTDDTGGNGYGGENELHLNIGNGGVVEFYIEGATNVSVKTPAVNDDAWHHVAATWDKTGGVNLYLDGAPAGSVAHTGNSFNFTGRVRLGRPNAGERYYAGVLDDLRLFKKALTVDQVKQTMRGDPLVAWKRGF